MKSYYNAPKNQSFFQNYYRLTPTLRLMGYLAQVITALAEVGISYRLLLSSIEEVFPEQAPTAALIGAVVMTIFLEVGLRRFLPFSFRAVLYRRFSGLHLLISIPVILITLALMVALGYLSVQGSHEIVRQMAPPPALANEAPIQDRFDQDRQQTWLIWKNDSSLLEQKFQALERGVEARYRARIAQNPSLVSYKEAEINTLQRKKMDALLEAATRRDQRLGNLEADRKEALAKVAQLNETSLRSANSKTHRFGSGLAWFTLIALGVFVFSIGIEEVHRKGSGMEEVVVPSQYSFRPGLFDEVQWAVENRINYRLRDKIKAFEALTPLLEELEVGSERTLVRAANLCRKCGKPYQARTTWHIFCSNKCRFAFREQKHGKPFLPNRVNGEKIGTELFE
jgi:hypothetical protein